MGNQSHTKELGHEKYPHEAQTYSAGDGEINPADIAVLGAPVAICAHELRRNLNGN
jgi:hypothetical protein